MLMLPETKLRLWSHAPVDQAQPGPLKAELIHAENYIVTKRAGVAYTTRCDVNEANFDVGYGRVVHAPHSRVNPS